MVTEKRVCPCRRHMTEVELFNGYSVAHEPRQETPLTAVEVRERYIAQRTTGDILRELAEHEHRLTVGGRR